MTKSSFSRSKNKLVQFLAMVLRDMDGHASGYHLPLTELVKTSCQRLITSLHQGDEEECIEQLHEVYFGLCGTVTDDLHQRRWADPLNCFIAVDSLRQDGLFIKASDLTPMLAVWKYNLRAMVLHQIIKTRSTFVDGQDG
jgi:hypothetical protein